MDNFAVNTDLPNIIVVALHFLFNLFDDYLKSLNFLRTKNNAHHSQQQHNVLENNCVLSPATNENAYFLLAYENLQNNNVNGIEMLNSMLSSLLSQKQSRIMTTTAFMDIETAATEVASTPVNGMDKKLYSYFQLKYEFIEST
jgi:hypothetical protein